jgi:RNA polymerase sigma factor (sigma-70 family)
MSDAFVWSTQMQLWLDRLRAGDDSARDELFKIAYEPLIHLARKMLRRFPGVRRWEQADDVLQNASLRLCHALSDVRPASVRSFINLAAVQIRRELIDLARRYDGPRGMGRHLVDEAGPDGSGTTSGPMDARDHGDDPARLESWTEFHAQIGALPGEEKKVFDLLWYQGLSQAEAATLLGVTERAVKYRWRSARLELQQRLDGRLPG